MTEKLYARADLLKESGLAEGALEDAERRGLIVAVGMADDAIPLYGEPALRRATHIATLLDMGYECDHVAKIVSEVGLPGSDREAASRPEGTLYLTVGELARRAGLNTRTIKYWEEKGILTPQSRSEGGYRLYTIHYVFFCNLVRDLQNFGFDLDQIKEVSDLFRMFYQLKCDARSVKAADARRWLVTMQSKIVELFDRTRQLKEGIERWETLLDRKKAEVAAMQEQITALLEETEARHEAAAAARN